MKRTPVFTWAIASALVVLFIIVTSFKVPGFHPLYNWYGTLPGEEITDTTKHHKQKSPYHITYGPVAISGVVKEILPDDNNTGSAVPSYITTDNGATPTTIYTYGGPGYIYTPQTIGGVNAGSFSQSNVTTSGNFIYLAAYREYASAYGGIPSSYAVSLFEITGPSGGICGTGDANVQDIQFQLGTPNPTIPYYFYAFNQASCCTTCAPHKNVNLYLYQKLGDTGHGQNLLATGMTDNNGMCNSFANGGVTYNLVQDSGYYIANVAGSTAYRFETYVRSAGVTQSTVSGLTVIFEY